MQVQEKLTPDEYKEFVSLMKALKSKTMKVTAVLERIANLFSGPQRFLLLKGYSLHSQLCYSQVGDDANTLRLVLEYYNKIK